MDRRVDRGGALPAAVGVGVGVGEQKVA
jgi:hypothetical protein